MIKCIFIQVKVMDFQTFKIWLLKKKRKPLTLAFYCPFLFYLLCSFGEGHHASATITAECQL